jgi:hypothetical protein
MMLYGSNLNWKIYEKNNDTIVEYSFVKEDLKNLRIYMNSLEMYKELYYNSGETFKEFEKSLAIFRKISEEQNEDILDLTLLDYNNNIIVTQLKKDLKTSKRNNWYYLGGGIIIGGVACLLMR